VAGEFFILNSIRVVGKFFILNSIRLPGTGEVFFLKKGGWGSIP